MSRRLSERSIDHVVLERGEVANSWRRERWDSLRLLTPNWLCRLPGMAYDGDEPDGFMTMPELIGFIDRYAELTAAPVETGTTVTRVSATDDGYRVFTDKGVWQCRTVVLASGAHNIPALPRFSEDAPSSVQTLTPHDYRNPEQLEDGGVLVVGASATGLQLAKEIHASGRPVSLSVGEHVRMPRLYRGRDIQWWMDASGILDQRYDEVEDIVRARRVSSPQLVGTPERSTLDLNALSDMGVEIAGRLAGFNGEDAQFSGSLSNNCKMADLKLGRLLDNIDEWARQLWTDHDLAPPERFAPTRVAESPRLSLNLRKERIGTILWATGYKPDYSWLDVPVLDRKGRIRHDGGIADAPGLYLMGLHFMRRRKSSFIHGADDDSRELSDHLAACLDELAGSPALQAAG